MTVEGVGVVAIGRNEGARLIACLRSALRDGAHVVYVDSGSSDGSVAAARELGAEVVELDLSRPFTAARARNAGFAALRARAPEVKFVQFVDGDCELREGWVEAAAAFLRRCSDAAVVAGRLRERFPGATIWNRLCDLEWDTPVGLAKYCGGIAMMRAHAFEAEEGFRHDLIAGEEPELCVRFRAVGWTIWRIDHEMALHDADMTRFLQWWRRSVRAGHAYAEGAALHGASPERHWVRETVRAVAWGAALPGAAVLLGLLIHPLAFALLLAWPAQAVRLALRAGGGQDAWLSGVLMVLGKIAEAQGVLRYARGRLGGRRAGLIEYKTPSRA